MVPKIPDERILLVSVEGMAGTIFGYQLLV